jgi:hypothetical protein
MLWQPVHGIWEKYQPDDPGFPRFRFYPFSFKLGWSHFSNYPRIGKNHYYQIMANSDRLLVLPDVQEMLLTEYPEFDHK